MLSVTVVNVDTFDDVIDSGDGLTSLREAVIAANASSNDYQIVLPAGTYALTRQGAGEDFAYTGDLDVLNNGSLSIIGPGAGSTTIDASGLYDGSLGYGDRILDVKVGASLSLEGLTLTGGSTQAFGGAINLSGNDSATISDCTFTGNSGGDGGAIYSNLSMLTISAGTFTDNSAVSGGGALRVNGVTTIADSTITDNSAGHGGGISTQWWCPTNHHFEQHLLQHGDYGWRDLQRTP